MAGRYKHLHSWQHFFPLKCNAGASILFPNNILRAKLVATDLIRCLQHAWFRIRRRDAQQIHDVLAPGPRCVKLSGRWKTESVLKF